MYLNISSLFRNPFFGLTYIRRSLFYTFFLFFLLTLLISCDRQSKEELLNEGQKYSQKGNYRGAVVLYKNALEKDPNYSEARFLLANAYLKVGKYESSEKEFNKVLRQLPDDTRVPLKLAELYLRTDRKEKTISSLNSYLKKHPDSADAYDILGQAYALNKNFNKAKEFFRKAIAIDAEKVLPQLHLAQVYLQLKENDLARELLESLISRNVKNVPAYYLLARMETSMGNREKALTIYQSLLTVEPKAVKAAYLAGALMVDLGKIADAEKMAADISSRFATRAEGSRLKGIIFYTKHKFNEAQVELLKSIKIQPDLTGYYFLGLTYYQTQKLELALNQFQKALDMAPSFNQARVMVAMTLLKQKRVDDAINEIQKAIKFKEDNSLAHNVLGSAYLSQGKYDLAMAEFDRAIVLNPNLASAHLKKGIFNLSQGNKIEAEKDLTTALSVAPEVLNTRFLLTSFYLRQQNYAAALKTLDEGLNSTPTDALLYNHMAAAYFAQKKPQKALNSLEKAKKANPEYFTPYFNIATYHSSKGEYEKAIVEYEAVLVLDEKNLKSIIAIGALSELSGNEEKAFQYFQKAATTETPGGYLALAQYLLRSKKYDDVPAVLENALNANPGNPAILELKGRLLAERGTMADAAPVFQELEKARPGRGIPLMIAAYLKKGEPDKALQMAQKVTSGSPTSPYGYLLSASVYEYRQELNDAEKTLQDGIQKVNRQTPVLKMRLGIVFDKMNKPELAMQTFQEVKKEFPNYSQADFAMGALNDKLGNKKEALKLYEDVLEKNPKHTASLNNAAYLYIENYSNPEKALELAMKAYRQDSSNPGIIDTMGYALYKNGRYAEAQRLLEKAVTLLPENATVAYHLALAQNQLGEKDKTAQILKKALSLGDFPEKEKSIKLLKSL